MTDLTRDVIQALIIDLVVPPQHRSKGLGRELVDAILRHPELVEVLDFELYCEDSLESWYKDFGFSRPSNGVLFLRRRKTEQAVSPSWAAV